MRFSSALAMLVAAPLLIIGDSKAATFIHLSDVHLNTQATNITYHEDTGTELWQSTLDKLADVLKQDDKPEFIVYTGDIPAHYNCTHPHCYLPDSERGPHNKNIATVLDDLRSLSQAHDTPLFYAPGNNDGLAGDYWSFTDSGHQPATPTELSPDPQNPYPALDTDAQCSANSSGACMEANPHPEFGYYAVRPVPGLRIVALNSIILGHKYYSADGTTQLEAGNNQMKWLAGQLAAAKAAATQQKVWIIMHIPPGLDAYAVNSSSCPAHPSPSEAMWAHLPRPDVGAQPQYWQDRFIQMLDAFDDTITGLFYGHTHMDELRRIYDAGNSEVTHVAFSAPGITPNHDNNPGFKVFSFDSTNMAPLSFITHYRTPSDADWMQYSSTDAYSCAQGSTLFDCIAGKDIADLQNEMNSIFMVKHGQPGYNTLCGIDVRPGQ